MSTPANPDDSTRKRGNRKRRALSERSIPFNVSMPYADLVKLEEEANRLGIDRSEVLRRALQFYYHYKESNIHEQANNKQTE